MSNTIIQKLCRRRDLIISILEDWSGDDTYLQDLLQKTINAIEIWQKEGRKMKTYQELKRDNQEELNEFKGIFFAFSNEQFKEGMEKLGLTKDDTKQIYSLGAGGYILKTRSKAFNDMFKRHNQSIKELRKCEKELVNAIAYELANHEYCITGDVTDALNALNIDISTLDPKILKRAIKKQNADCVECNS